MSEWHPDAAVVVDWTGVLALEAMAPAICVPTVYNVFCVYSKMAGAEAADVPFYSDLERKGMRRAQRTLALCPADCAALAALLHDVPHADRIRSSILPLLPPLRESVRCIATKEGMCLGFRLLRCCTESYVHADRFFFFFLFFLPVCFLSPPPSYCAVQKMGRPRASS